MKFLDELKPLKLYKKYVWLPINIRNKRKGSVIFLLTPNFESTVKCINSANFFDTRYFNGYYVEKDISFIIDSNKKLVRIDDEDENTEEDAVQESSTKNYLKEPIDYYPPYLNEQDYILDDRFLATNESIIFFSDNDDENVILSENAANDVLLRKLLFKERIRTTKDLLNIHERIKASCPKITNTRLYMKQYKGFNLYYDLSYYNNTFFKNNMYKLKKGVELYLDFLSRIIRDRRLASYNYTNDKLIMVPIEDWDVNKANKKYMFKNDINPVSALVYLIKYFPERLKKEFAGLTFLFFGGKGYFKLDIDAFQSSSYNKLLLLLDQITDPNYNIIDDEPDDDSPKAMTVSLIDNIEKKTGIKFDNVEPEKEVKPKEDVISTDNYTSNNVSDVDIAYKSSRSNDIEEKKKLLVTKISNTANESSDEDDLMDKLNNDEDMKKLLNDLMMDSDEGVKLSAARSSRLTALNSEFEKKSINNKTVKEILSIDESKTPIEKTELKIDTINDEWKNLSFINFEKSYDLNSDIVKILYSFTEKDYPVSIIDMNVEDTSTSEDWIYTYRVNCEDGFGNRFTLVFDVPKFKDYRFMRLRGNDKVMNGQLVLIGVSKTNDDTAQVVSNYRKIIISRKGMKGKSLSITDRLIKALKRADESKIKIKSGMNSKICKKYELPIDYIDMSNLYTTISTKNFIFYFNQDDIRAKYKDIIDKGDAVPVGYNKKDKSIIYYDGSSTFTEIIYNLICVDYPEFEGIFEKTMLSTKYCYSEASILNERIPLIIVMGYNEGLQKTMRRAHIKYELKDKKEYNKLNQDIIKFSDGYLVYDLNYNSSLLMNGIKESDTAMYSLTEIDNKQMFLDLLDNYGGRIKADGLENFYQLEIDPITKETLERFNLPTDYSDVLAYANELLSDNTFTKHTDLSSNRYRTNEQIAAYVYSVLADEYGRYRTACKRNPENARMSIKRSAVIDNLLQARETSDLSILTPLLELESANTASFKGKSGLNNERAYGVDKRNYDDSMINVLALSTGFAGNVGINRQTTIDMNIDSVRGYIKKPDINEMNVTKTLSITEALNPFCSTRDDPIRMAMNFVQSSKHCMITDQSDPLLISNGADEAMPYLCSDTYSVKAKANGIIKELSKDYMIIEYPTEGNYEYIDLKNEVKKNSDGGFYVSVKLDAYDGLKVGDKVSENQILAYNKRMFSNCVGYRDDISYNIGPLCKIAMPITDEGYEDSAIISEWLSEALAFDMVSQVECVLDKDANVLSILNKGDNVFEGDPLMIYQNAYDDEDMNALLKILANDNENITDFGRTKVKSKLTGFIADIEILRSCEIDELSDSLKKIVTDYEKPITAMRKKIEKYDPEAAKNLPADYKLPATGRLKNCEDKIKIIFSLSYKNKMSVGNKLTYFSALKGVVKDIFPKGEEPRSSYRPDETIHTMMSVCSANGRMTISPFINASINKVLIELARHCRDIMGIESKMLDEYFDPENKK